MRLIKNTALVFTLILGVAQYSSAQKRLIINDISQLQVHCCIGANYTPSFTISHNFIPFYADSFFVSTDFGDGTIIKKSILVPADTNFSFTNGPHTYLQAGKFTVKTIVSSPDGLLKDTTIGLVKPEIFDRQCYLPMLDAGHQLFVEADSIPGSCSRFVYPVALNNSDNRNYVYGLSCGQIAFANNLGDSLKGGLNMLVNFGDGTTDVLTLNPDDFNSTERYSFSYEKLKHAYSIAGTYSVKIIVRIGKKHVDSLVFKNIVTIANGCSPVSGKVYWDKNQNCTFDNADEALVNVPIKLVQNGNTLGYYFTDEKGNYTFNYYQAQLFDLVIEQNELNQRQLSPICPINAAYTSINSPTSNRDFALMCKPGYDLSVSLEGPGYRPGVAKPFNIIAQNFGCVPKDAVVKLILDKNISLQSSSPQATVFGDTLVWNLQDLSSSSSSQVALFLYTDTLVKPDSLTNQYLSICSDIWIEPSTGDRNLANNRKHQCFSVRSSFDPNAKTLSPQGTGTYNALPLNSEITYRIDFQNVGNDTAYKVVVIDTLSNDLDFNTFKLVSSSHPVQLEMLNARVLRLVFNNILLPDSNTNKHTSCGYVNFTIKANDFTPAGKLIKNKALIYFDANAPIATKSADFSIEKIDGINDVSDKLRVSLSPNPASEQCLVQWQGSDIEEIKVVDITGRSILQKSVTGHQALMIATDWNKGLYFVQFINNRKVLSTQKLMVK